MKIRITPILLLLAITSLGVHAQPITHPVAFGATTSGYLNNWYKNYVGMRLDVVTPASVAGEKVYSMSNDGSGATGTWGGLVTTPLVNKTVVMPQAGDSLATVAITTAMTGKVALVYRGTNEFSDKALAAQTAGAIACIIVNNRSGGPAFPSGGVVAASVTIPVFMISKADGDALDLQYLAGSTITVTLTPWGRNNNNDLGFVPEGIAGWSNFATPANQLNAGSVRSAMKLGNGAFIANYGLHKATNVKISDTLTYTPASGSPSIVNTGITPNLATFLPADSIYAMFNATEANFPATAPGNGRFDLKYTILSDSADQYAGDNKATYSFYKTDSLYSKGKYDFVKNVPSVGNYIALSGGTSFMWGPMYYVAHSGTCLSSVQFSLSDPALTVGPVPAGSVNVHAYKWVDGVGGTLDSFMENGELTEVSMGTYNFLPTDSLGGIFKVRMGDLSGTPAGILLDSTSWYYIAVEVPSGLTLGVEGEHSPYPRVYGRDVASSISVDYANVMWPGDYSSFTSSSPAQAEAPCGFPAVFYVNSVDSFNYSNLKGLIPAVSMIVNNNPLSLISGPSGVCVGSSHTYSDPITGGTWTSSNPSAATIGLTTGDLNAVAAGTTTITYSTSAGFATLTVTVAPFVMPGSIAGPGIVCAGSTITLTDPVPGGFWAIDSSLTIAASVSSTGVVTGLLAGSSESIYYIISNACNTTFVGHFVAVGPAIVTGALTGPSAVCVGSTVTLSASVASGTWSTGSGNASVIGGAVTGVNAGTDVVSYTVTTSCGSAATTAPITINPLPVPVVVTSGVNLSTTIAYSTYQWLYAGGAIGGATSSTYTATLDGAYAVTVTDANGCTGTSALALVSSTGVDNVGSGALGITVAPNPTSGTFTVQSNNAGTFTVYSMEGREIKRYTIVFGNTSLSLPQALAAGVYMCRFENENGAKSIVRLVYEPK